MRIVMYGILPLSIVATIMFGGRNELANMIICGWVGICAGFVVGSVWGTCLERSKWLSGEHKK
jgi:hypothetical protein